MPDEQDMVLVYTGEFMAGAQLKDLLGAEGIKVFLQDEIMSTMHPVVGRVRVMVGRDDVKRAEPIVSEFVASRSASSPSEEFPEEPQRVKTIFLGLAAALLVFLVAAWFARQRPTRQYERQRYNQSAEFHRSLDEIRALYDEGKYTRAIPIAQRAVRIAEETIPSSEDLEDALGWLALCQTNAGDYNGAVVSFERHIDLKGRRVGAASAGLVYDLSWLLRVYMIKGQYDRADPLAHRIIEIVSQTAGPEHHDVINARRDLRDIYVVRGEYEQAVSEDREIVSALSARMGADHPDVAMALESLAWSYDRLGQSDSAIATHERALTIQERRFGPEHPALVPLLVDYADLLRHAGKDGQVQTVKMRIERIQSQLRNRRAPETVSSGNTTYSSQAPASSEP